MPLIKGPSEQACNGRCEKDKCRKHTNVMGFNCRFCHHRFCYKHQLPESHECNVRDSDIYDNYKAESLLNWVPKTSDMFKQV